MRRGRNVDPVKLSIYHHLLSACAEEMGVVLGRAASSANIKERRDYSCAVFDDRGRMVAQAAHIPVHLGSMPLSVEAALARGPLEPGDAILLNDPYEGGTHLPDITLVAPVFLPGEKRARFYVANRAHHADVGGMSPGSLPLATELVQEGVRIPPVHIVRRGVVQADLWRLICANVRTPDERQADLEAQLGAAATGAKRLAELATRSGVSELSEYVEHLFDYAERGVRAVLASIKPGRYTAVDYLDGDGVGGERIPIRVAITVHRGGRATIDFTGSAPQVEGPLNAVASITLSAVLYVFRCLAGASLPTNAGCLRPLEVIAPAGTIVAARPPAAVSSGNVETSQRITDVLLGALARALPGRVPASSYGTMNNVLIGGLDSAGAAFAYYETLGGGHGGGPDGPGASGMQAHMTNTLNTPIEAFEHLFPMRVRRYALRRGSGGAGKHRGGEGLVREIELLVPATVTVISERRVLAPPGLAGGAPGKRGRNARVVAGGRGRAGRVEELPGKFQQRFAAGDVLIVESPGGGGWGRGGGRALSTGPGTSSNGHSTRSRASSGSRRAKPRLR